MTTSGAQVDRAPDARRQLFVADLMCLAAGALIMAAVRRPLGIAPTLAGEAATAHVLLFALFAVVSVLQLGLLGQYDSGIRFSRLDDLLVVSRATFRGIAVAVFLAVATKGFFLGFESYSRAYVTAVVLSGVALLVASRFLGHALQVRAFAEGRYLAHALVIGSGDRAQRFLDWLDEHPHLGLTGRMSEVDDELPVGAYMSGLTEELDRTACDEVVLALSEPRPDLRAAIVREASVRGVAVKVLPDVFENYYDMPYPRYEGIPVATIYETPSDRFARSVKHAVDRVGAAAGLLLLSPMFAAIAAAIWIEDRGPVLFAQERVGERGLRFRVKKFRTMQLDAESRLEALRVANEADGPIFKMREDPRVTRVGRWLRRTSFDEFPQLWNVAFGEMSLVGPRPPIPSEVDEYRIEHRRRLLARPGMTGLWQVSGRSETTFDEMVELDLQYIENWSFWLDLKILLRTVLVVVSRRGAY